MNDRESGINSNSENSKRIRSISERRDVRRKQETLKVIPDVCMISSSLSLSVDKVQHSGFSDPMHRSLKQYMDSHFSAIKQEILSSFRQEIQSSFRQEIKSSVRQEMQKSMAQMKEVLLHSITPTSNDSMSTPLGEDNKANALTRLHVGRKLFDSKVFNVDEESASPPHERIGFCALRIPVTFEVPKGMNIDEKEWAVATYLYNVDGFQEETIVKHTVLHGYRKSFGVIIPGECIDSDVLTMVSCMLTHEERTRPAGQKIWFLPPEVSQLALSRITTPQAVVSGHKSLYMSSVKKLLKIYIPINDDKNHWYLLCVDLKRKELICLDSLISSSRIVFRERQIRQVAVFLEDMIDWKCFYENLENDSHEIGEVIHRLGEFRIKHPRNLPQQKNLVDCGVWVASWQIYSELKRSFRIDPVDDKSRMRLALDLVLKNYNEAREDVIRNAIDFVKEKKREQLYLS